MTATKSTTTRFEHASPILAVRNMAASLAYYRDALGFRATPWGSEHFTLVSRDGAGIYLCQDGQGGPGTWLWVGVHDVAALHAEYQASGAHIRAAPVNYAWAYELQVEDPDGHVLRFGSEPRKDMPIVNVQSD